MRNKRLHCWKTASKIWYTLHARTCTTAFDSAATQYYLAYRTIKIKARGNIWNATNLLKRIVYQLLNQRTSTNDVYVCD